MKKRIKIAVNDNRGDLVLWQCQASSGWSCGEKQKPKDGSFAISSVTLAASVKFSSLAKVFRTSYNQLCLS